jgi:3-deoxy-D-manno-octulosonic-acid transferase
LGLQSLRWSASDDSPHIWDVLILGETGWLPVFYRHATAAIIGGSFVNQGGHNLIEAAAQTRAIIIGPYVQHFESIVEEYHRTEAIVWLNSHLELTPALHSLLADPIKQIELAKRAVAVVESQRGIAQEYARLLVKKLEERIVFPGHDRTRMASMQEKHDVPS